MKKPLPRVFTHQEIREMRRDVVTAAQAKKVGDARRIAEAMARSSWDKYRHISVTRSGHGAWLRLETGAIAAARAGDVCRLVDLLRARRTMYADDYHQLIDFILSRKRRRLWSPWLVTALSQLPTEATYDRLADFIEAIGRRRGSVLNEPVHRAARLAEALMTLYPGRVPDALSSAIIDYACALEGDDCGVMIDSERVRDLLNRPRVRRHKH